MATKYKCGNQATNDCRNGKPTVEQNYDNEDFPSLKEALQYADNEINEGIDQSVKNKTLRQILKNKTTKTALSAASLAAGHAVWGMGMAIGGEPGTLPAMAGIATMSVASMGLIHNVSTMKMTKAFYHGVKAGIKTTARELSPEIKKIKDKVGSFYTALTEKDIPMTVRHYDPATEKMVECKMPQRTLSTRLINAFQAAQKIK